MQKTVCCDTIGDLDNGVARLLIDQEIERAVADLEDRAAEDGKSRKVVIELELAKKDGMTVTNVAAQAKLPPRRSKATVARVRQQGSRFLLLFQDEAADNPDQTTFEFKNND